MTKLYFCRCRCNCGVVLASGLACAFCRDNHIQLHSVDPSELFINPKTLIN